MSMHCYVRDFGAKKFAICELELPRGVSLTATQPLAVGQDTSPKLWAQLGALLVKSGEVVEAQ